MAFVLSSVSGNLISAASAGYAPTNSADVSAIASAYQVVSATATQLYAGTSYLTSVNEAPISAERAGNAANASLATSAWYDGTGRFISALPDSAAVSSIASAYAESAASSKQDTLSFAYNTADQISSINGSALGGMDENAVSSIASAYAESAASSKLDASASSSFYTTANESGFLTGVDLSPYQTTADMSSYIPTSMSSDFQQVTGMSSYALSSDVSATVDLVGTQSANWGGSALALSAGPGVKLEKVGDTLVVSNDETVLFTGESFSATLSESIKNFSRMYIEYGPTNYYSAPMAWYNTEAFSANDVFGGVHLEFVEHNGSNAYCFPKNTTFVWGAGFTSLNATGGLQYRVSGNAIQNELTGNQLYIRKIVGVNRTAGV